MIFKTQEIQLASLSLKNMKQICFLLNISLNRDIEQAFGTFLHPTSSELYFIYFI